MMWLTRGSPKLNRPLTLWEEFERLNIADDDALRTFCRKWHLVQLDAGKESTFQWYSSVDEEDGFLIHPEEIREFHASFIKAVEDARLYTQVVAQKNQKKGMSEAERLLQRIAQRGRAFLELVSPVPQVEKREDLARLVIGHAPALYDKTLYYLYKRERTNRITVGAIYFDLLASILEKQPVLQCALGHHFIATAHQRTLAFKHKKRVLCPDCKANKGDYELRKTPERLADQRERMERKRHPERFKKEDGRWVRRP